MFADQSILPDNKCEFSDNSEIVFEWANHEQDKQGGKWVE